MHICFHCSKTIETSKCLYQKNFYHASCCRICLLNPKPAPKKLKTPPPISKPAPPPPKIEIADPKKSRAGPGRLNFNQIGSFEASKDVDCIDCKKKIVGQRFLTHKLGEFCCKKCNSLKEEKCWMCKDPFETEECFNDDVGNKYCAKCIKIYLEEKKHKAKQLAEAEAAAKSDKLITVQPEEPTPEQVSIITTIHCDCCTKPLTTSILEMNGSNYHFACLVCHLCKIQLKDKNIYQDENGLVCEKCKNNVKCYLCKTSIDHGKNYYEEDNHNACCISCFNKLHSKTCSSCPKPIEPGTSHLLFKDKNFHLDCFLCSTCNKKIGEDGKEFSVDENKKFCEICFIKYRDANKNHSNTIKCAAIQYITVYPTSNNIGCKRQSFNNESFYKEKIENSTLINSFKKINNKKCSACSRLISLNETSISINEKNLKNYHKNCLKCHKCLRVLSEKEHLFSNEESILFCENCI